MRKNYTDADEVHLDAQRPQVLNSIIELAVQGDLLDRSMILHLPFIGRQERRSEQDFWSQFADAQPRILGAVLDAVSMALRNWRTIALDQLPRMADFAIWACAAAPACDWRLTTPIGELAGAPAFLEAYRFNQEEATSVALETSLLARAVCAVAERDGLWEGSYLDLLNVLKRIERTHHQDAEWPKTPRKLSADLRRLVPLLREADVIVDFASTDSTTSGAGREAGNGRRRVVVRKQEVQNNSHKSHKGHAMMTVDINSENAINIKAPIEKKKTSTPCEILDLPDASIYYYPAFFTNEEADNYFQSLLTEVVWEQLTLFVFGKQRLEPRLTAWYGDEGAAYSYSGTTRYPKPWTPLLLEIKQRVENAAGVRYNSLLLNQYRNGNDSVSWHSDDEYGLGHNPSIASVSFGTVRSFHLRHRQDKKLRHKIDLEHGSLLLMQGVTQHYWHHQVPKTNKAVGSRINLTFRVIIK